MFTRFHSRLPWIAALLMLMSSAAASATTLAWSPNPLRAGPGWARTATSASDQAPLSSLWDEHVLFAFTGAAPYGGLPDSPLLPDGKGNFFGTTRSNGNSAGCNNLCGTVFELSPPAPGESVWRQRVLHTFNGFDGSMAQALYMDPHGNLFGTTFFGGNGACYGGCGVIFELTPPAKPGGEWTEKTIYAFNGPDGMAPSSPLDADASGSLYGVTVAGGGRGISKCDNFGCGEVFKLTPPAAGKTAWTETILHSFSGGADGFGNFCGVLMKDGVVYGSSDAGGAATRGFIYALTHEGASWKESILYAFAGDRDGSGPTMNLIADSSGALYGVTYLGGGSKTCKGGCGTIFKLEPPARSQVAWKETILHAFQGSDGTAPYGNGQLLADSRGQLYATTSGGTGRAAYGTVFKLAPPATGKTAWVLSTLQFFDGSDGQSSLAGLTEYKGQLFGSTFEGGNPGSACTGFGCGILFRLAP